MAFYGADLSQPTDYNNTEHRSQFTNRVPTSPTSAPPIQPLPIQNQNPPVSNISFTAYNPVPQGAPPPPIGWKIPDPPTATYFNQAGSTGIPPNPPGHWGPQLGEQSLNDGNINNHTTTTAQMNGVANKLPTFVGLGATALVHNLKQPEEGSWPQQHGNGGTMNFAPKYVQITESLANNLKNKNKFVALFRTTWSNNPSNQVMQQQQPVQSDWNWSNPSFVRLPLSSQYRARGGTLKWDIIQHELAKLKSVCEANNGNIAYQLGESIKTYNSGVSHGSNFHIPHDPELSQQLKYLLPVIVDYALKITALLGEPIPKLKRGESKTIYVTRELACSLMAHCFLCTVLHEGRDDDMPEFHCARLFNLEIDDQSRSQLKKEKLKCMLEYFSQMATVSADEGNKIISFERRCISKRVEWANSEARLCPFGVNSQTGIETAIGMLQVDFANKRVGGGVLGNGMVMEEIRFAICPELILARLFTEPLEDDEVLVITGTKQFSSYTGYQSSFQFRPCDKNAPSHVPIDGLGREFAQVVAMDALHFKEHSKSTQYQKKLIDRELHKCFVAFISGTHHVAPVATGNWGCGIFNGDKQLKILLQWMAASVVGRPGITFHIPEDQGKSVTEMGNFLQKRNVSVGKLYKILLKYDSQGRDRGSLFNFISQTLK